MGFDIGLLNLGLGLDNPRQARPIFGTGLDNPCPGPARPIDRPIAGLGTLLFSAQVGAVLGTLLFWARVGAGLGSSPPFYSHLFCFGLLCLCFVWFLNVSFTLQGEKK